MSFNLTSSEEQSEMFGTGDAPVLLAAFVEICLCILGTFGNLLTCLAVIKKRGLQVATNYFIASLAVADFLVSAILVPMRAAQHITIYSGKGHVPTDYIQLAGFVGRVNILASISNLAALSVDRWVALAFPMRYHTSLRFQTGKVLIIIAVIWLFAIFFTSLPKFPGIEDTTFLVGFVIFVLLVTVIIIIAYYRIFRIAMKLSRRRNKPNVRFSSVIDERHKSLKVVKPNSTLDNVVEEDVPDECHEVIDESQGADVVEIDEPDHNQERDHEEKQEYENSDLKKNVTNKQIRDNPKRSSPASSHQERKAAKTIAIVICAFIVLVYPRIILIIYHMFNKETHSSKLARFWIRIFLYANSSINPILYAWRNTDYRNQFVKILKVCACVGFWKRQRKILMDRYTVSSSQEGTQNTSSAWN